MKTATSNINDYALLLEDAQTEIRLIVKTAFFNFEPLHLTEQKIVKLINKAISKIKIPRLRRDSYYSLISFANTQKDIWRSLGLTPFLVAYIGAQASKDFPIKTLPTKEDKRFLAAFNGSTDINYPTQDKGVPLQRFYKQVWYEKIKPTLDNLCKSVALDPNDYTGRNSLRNLAEMEVRYQAHQDNIADLKQKGLKIVECSAHEDCSERCYPWQKQRLFSLDGTYGEIDGKKYIPLEVATDIYYTTKAGRRYKNGLLGFNCRHDLFEYKGYLTPTVSAKTRKEEYKITQKQRALEREVRRKRIEALMLKDINKQGYLQAKAQANALIRQYEEYSRKNNRAYYPMRLAI